MTNDQKPMTNETALREARRTLSAFEQMKDAQSQCVPCKLCGGKAIVSDAGSGAGYYIQCSNADTFRPSQGCLITERRLGGWAYNVMEWWNRLHAQSPSQPVVAGTVNFPAHADDCEAMLRPRADCTCVPTLAHPQASPPPVQSEVTLENIAFLEEAARYFERRPTEGEDMAHWANVYNAKNCRDIAAKLTRLAHSQPDTQDHVAEAGKMVTSLTSELATVKKRLESAGDRIADAVAESIALEFKGFWDADDLVNEIPTMIRDAASRLLQEQEKQNG